MNAPDNKNNEGKKSEDLSLKNLIGKKENSRLFSVISLSLAVLSLLLCFLPAVGIILSLLAVVFTIVSRRALGYFEGVAIAGLVVAVFGIVFCICAMCFESFFSILNFF